MLRLFVAVTFILISVAPVQAQRKPQRRNSHCNPIGVVNIPQGRQVCLGGTNILRDNVQVLCYSTAQLIPVVGGKLSQQCLPPKQRVSEGNHRSLKTQRKTRSEDDTNQLTLVEPYGSVQLDDRPTIRWQPISGVKSYQVRIVPAGSQPMWFRTVEATQLLYPAEEQSLRPGAVYTVVVQAVDSASSTEVRQDSNTLIRPVEEQIERINSAVLQLKSQGLSADDEALRLELLFRGFRLQQESIALLESRVKSGSKNPDIFRVLGDIYLEEGYPKQARSHYQSALKLASQQNLIKVKNQVQSAIVAMDEIASQRPPSNMKGAQ